MGTASGASLGTFEVLEKAGFCCFGSSTESFRNAGVCLLRVFVELAEAVRVFLAGDMPNWGMPIPFHVKLPSC